MDTQTEEVQQALTWLNSEESEPASEKTNAALDTLEQAGFQLQMNDDFSLVAVPIQM